MSYPDHIQRAIPECEPVKTSVGSEAGTRQIQRETLRLSWLESPVANFADLD